MRDVAATRSDILVAVVGDDIVGFIAGGPRPAPTNGYDTQLHAIYVSPPHHNQGIGRMLVQAWAAFAVERGSVGARVHVLANNPARGFYEHLRARHLEDIEVVIGGDTYTETCYGWTDLRALVG
jgi:GNAT superfamily N-acetyltransferase